MSAISLTSLPAAKTRSPPYSTTALTSSRAVASAAAARISSWTWTLIAFIFGRSSRIVPTPSATSSRTNSPIGSLHLIAGRSGSTVRRPHRALFTEEFAAARRRHEEECRGDTGNVEPPRPAGEGVAGAELPARVHLVR